MIFNHFSTAVINEKARFFHVSNSRIHQFSYKREPIWSAEGANNQLTIQKKINGRNSQIERINHGRKKRIEQKNIGDGVPGRNASTSSTIIGMVKRESCVQVFLCSNPSAQGPHITIKKRKKYIYTYIYCQTHNWKSLQRKQNLWKKKFMFCRINALLFCTRVCK